MSSAVILGRHPSAVAAAVAVARYLETEEGAARAARRECVCSRCGKRCGNRSALAAHLKSCRAQIGEAAEAEVTDAEMADAEVADERGSLLLDGGIDDGMDGAMDGDGMEANVHLVHAEPMGGGGSVGGRHAAEVIEVCTEVLDGGTGPHQREPSRSVARPASPAPSPSPSLARSASAAPSPSRSLARSASAAPSPSPSPSLARSASAAPSPSPSPSPSLARSAAPSPSPSRSRSGSVARPSPAALAAASLAPPSLAPPSERRAATQPTAALTPATLPAVLAAARAEAGFQVGLPHTEAAGRDRAVPTPTMLALTPHATDRVAGGPAARAGQKRPREESVAGAAATHAPFSPRAGCCAEHSAALEAGEVGEWKFCPWCGVSISRPPDLETDPDLQAETRGGEVELFQG